MQASTRMKFRFMTSIRQAFRYGLHEKNDTTPQMHPSMQPGASMIHPCMHHPPLHAAHPSIPPS